GGGCAAGPRRGARRPHLVGDRPPPLHGATRTHDPGRRRRRDRRAGHPRGAVGSRRPLRRSLPRAVPRRPPRGARMDLHLTDRAYLVTGAGRGLGLATAQALLDDGARVLLSGRTAESLVAAADGHGDRAAWQIADNADPAA